MKNRDVALKIIKKLQEAGFQAVFVGGCVRDEMLGLNPHDFDVATNARPEEISKLFKKTLDVGAAFGVMVVVEDGETIEVATFRKDGEYSDRRRPDSVEFSTLEEDIKRRDFTINALAFDPINNQLFDFVDGVEDLDTGVIRTVGNPDDRFNEDPLRVLRAIRFALRFNFSLDDRTAESIQRFGKKDLVSLISRERISQELRKMFVGSNKSFVIAGLVEHNLKQFIPVKNVNFFLAGHNFEKFDEDILWALLFFKHFWNSKENKEEGHILNKLNELKFSSDFQKMILQLLWLSEHLFKFDNSFLPEEKRKIVIKFREQGRKGFQFLEALVLVGIFTPVFSKRFLEFVNSVSNESLTQVVTGKDLINLGFKPGVKFGKILDWLFDEQLKRGKEGENLELLLELAKLKLEWNNK